MAGRLDSAVESSVVTVSTPNEMVHAELRGERHVSVRFAAGHLEQVSHAVLERELASLARLAFAAALAEHARLGAVVTGRVPTRRPRIGRREKEYDQRLAELAAEGVSDDGEVTVTSVGQQHHAVRLRPGCLDRLDAEQLARSCAQAAERLLLDTETRAARARWDVYMGTPLPGT